MQVQLIAIVGILSRRAFEYEQREVLVHRRVRRVYFVTLVENKISSANLTTILIFFGKITRTTFTGNYCISDTSAYFLSMTENCHQSVRNTSKKKKLPNRKQ